MIAIRSLTGERGQGQTFRQNDFIVLNDLVCAGLRDKVNALIPLVKEL